MVRCALVANLWLTLVSAAVLNVDRAGYIKYTTVTGYFLQDDPATNASTFDYTAVNFGLINRTYPVTIGIGDYLTQWQKFEIQVAALNAAAGPNTVYKVFFFGRHGEGYHNTAQSYYGTPAWNCYWAELTGNGTSVWEDARLTPNGVAQAQIAHNFWRHELEVQHIPYPQSYYTSPLTRCLQTANITFSGLNQPAYHPFIPTVKEYFREGISIHTCDHRGNKSYIHNLFPKYIIEPKFTFYDELWNGVSAETNSAQQKRSLTVLDKVFTSDSHTWISVTSHSGEIATILQVLGHRVFPLNTGAVIPVLVKAQLLPASAAPSSSVQPFTTSTWCHNAPPITSIGTLSQGCVCQSTTAPLPSLPTVASYSASSISRKTPPGYPQSSHTNPHWPGHSSHSSQPAAVSY